MRLHPLRNHKRYNCRLQSKKLVSKVWKECDYSFNSASCWLLGVFLKIAKQRRLSQLVKTKHSLWCSSVNRTQNRFYFVTKKSMVFKSSNSLKLKFYIWQNWPQFKLRIQCRKKNNIKKSVLIKIRNSMIN